VTTIKELQETLENFDQSFPRPGVANLPSRLKQVKFTYEQGWPELWSDGGVLRAYAEDPCVYFFFNEEEELMYIGSTRNLGKRFKQHFDVKGAKWKDQTRNLAILPLKNDSWFEILAIEAYLIQELNPPQNKVGTRRRAN
jgi:hypothetical protein